MGMGFRYGVSPPYDEDQDQDRIYFQGFCSVVCAHHCEILYVYQRGAGDDATMSADRFRENGHPLRSTHVLANFE